MSTHTYMYMSGVGGKGGERGVRGRGAGNQALRES